MLRRRDGGRRAGARRRGVAAAEFAAILPVLLLMVLACVDFGRFAYTYIAVTNAARAGAGFGSNNAWTTGTLATWQSQVKQAVTNEMGSVSGYDVSQVTASTVTESSGLWRAEVTVPCQFTTIIPWPSLPQTMTVRRKVVMRGLQ